MIHPCKPHNLAAIICLSMLVVFAAGNLWAEETDAKNPLRFWEGKNKSYIEGSFWVETAYFTESNAWFGESKANIGNKSKTWWETVFFPKLEGSYVFDHGGEIYGRASAVYANTDGQDAAGSNNAKGDMSVMRMEDAVAGWRSGDVFSSLGKDFLDISFGRQRYQVGDGFFFWGQSANGNRRGANWIGDRHAAQYSGIMRLRMGGWASDLIYYRRDDSPNTDTRVGGALLEYNFSDTRAGNRLNYADNDGVAYLGGGLYHVQSDVDTRDKMMMYYMRGAIKPFQVFGDISALKPFRVEAEYMHQDTDDNDIGNGDAWYIEPRYQFDNVPWKPMIIYRYSTFDKDFYDPGYGDGQWDKWNQGEILGEFVLDNSNLNTNTVNLRLFPIDAITVNLVYLNFKLDDADAFGVDDKAYADEVDLIIDWEVNDHLAFIWVGAWCTPDDAAKQSTGGDDDWYHMMLYTFISF